MAWCQNPSCKKDGLRKADVEFDDTSKLILCHGCYALMHPGWIPPAEYVDVSDRVPSVALLRPHVGFAIQVTDQEGLKAKISYGGASLAIHVPTEDFKKTFGF